MSELFYQHEDAEALPEPVAFFRGIGWGVAFQVIGFVLFAIAVVVGVFLYNLIRTIHHV